MTYVKNILRAILGKSDNTTKARPKVDIGSMPGFLNHCKLVGFEPNHILDVGAHEATWSTYAKETFGDSFVYMIEPQSNKREALHSFVSRHNNCKYLNVGLAEQLGKRELTIWEDGQGTSFRPNEIGMELDLKTETVNIETIDNLIATGWLKSPDLIKIDVQGYEKNVIQGAGSVLGETELIIMELSLYPFMQSDEVYEMMSFMKARGYVMYDIAGYIRRPYDNALAQIDVAFAREDGFLRKYQRWD